MDDVLIAEDLLLLLLDDESGKLGGNAFAGIDTAIGGAFLVELSLRGAVELTEKQGFRRPRVVPAADAPPLPPLLADALTDIDDKERTAPALVTRLGRHRKEPLLDRLVDRHLIRREHDRILGLFPRTRWPAVDDRHETEVRRRIEQALIAGHTHDERTAALISLLSALEVVSKVVAIDQMSGREVTKRAKAIAESDWASRAVRDAVAATQAAVIGAIVAAGAAGST